MKVLYATDMHGHSKKFKLLRDNITDHDVLVIGADILPKHNVTYFIENQKTFIQSFLPKYFESINIPIIIDMGNDDCKCLYEDFKSVVNDFDHVHISHLNNIEINGYHFVGMHFVPDYPFGLKDWCRRDGDRLSDPIQISRPLITENYEFKPLDIHLDEYFKSHYSIGHHLNSLERPKDKNKYIFMSHCPPKGLGLDVCMDYRTVGSMNIANYIMMTNPVVSLHGHIHESPFKSGVWFKELSNTCCIQPGQAGGFQSLIYCEFVIEDFMNTLNRKEVK